MPSRQLTCDCHTGGREDARKGKEWNKGRRKVGAHKAEPYDLFVRPWIPFHWFRVLSDFNFGLSKGGHCSSGVLLFQCTPAKWIPLIAAILRISLKLTLMFIQQSLGSHTRLTSQSIMSWRIWGKLPLK